MTYVHKLFTASIDNNHDILYYINCVFPRHVFASRVSGAAIQRSLPCHLNLYEKRINKC